MSARRRAILASVLIIGGSLAIWFAALATLDTTGQGDCPVTPPAAVPGPPVEAGR